MTSIVDFIFFVLAAFLGKIEGLLAINLPPPPPDFSTKCKIALLLSAFACTPSVLANDLPLATLSVDNIQVHADWKVVGDDADHFSVDGGILRLRPNISGVGGKTITAIVEVRDKFSTLNPSYEDLAVSVMITAVIMGCSADWTRNLAKSYDRELSSPSKQIAVEYGSIDDGDVIARIYTDENGYNHINLYTVSATYMNTGFSIPHGIDRTNIYITTDPTSLYDNLKWDFGISPTGYTTLAVNGSADCFAEEIQTLEDYNYFNANAPLITGLYSGIQARTVIVSESRVSDNKQYFYLNDVTLANILNDVFPPKVIIDNGKAFSIDLDDSGVEDGGSRYEYISNITGGGVTYSSMRAFIFLNHDCPIIGDAVTATKAAGTPLKISAGDFDKAEGKTYVLIQGNPYRFTGLTPASDGDYNINAEGFSDSSLAAGIYQIKFTDDHFLCE